MNRLLLEIGKFKKAYGDRELNTDEYAEVMNILQTATHKLESTDIKTGKDYILLKWGTIKGSSLHSERGKELTSQYNFIGRSASAIMQKDTDVQKKIILEMIDECDGSIQSDWSGEYFTKDEAKKYILKYKSK